MQLQLQGYTNHLIRKGTTYKISAEEQMQDKKMDIAMCFFLISILIIAVTLYPDLPLPCYMGFYRDGSGCSMQPI